MLRVPLLRGERLHHLRRRVVAPRVGGVRERNAERHERERECDPQHAVPGRWAGLLQGCRGWCSPLPSNVRLAVTAHMQLSHPFCWLATVCRAPAWHAHLNVEYCALVYWPFGAESHLSELPHRSWMPWPHPWLHSPKRCWTGSAVR